MISLLKIIFPLLFINSFIIAQKNTPTGLKVGSKAPEFATKNQNNNIVSLQQSLKSGPVVLLFYRGEWCPVCNRQLKSLQDSLTMIMDKGATVIAISPESLEYVEKND